MLQALQVLEFLVKRGSDHCIALANEDIQGHLQNLRLFEYIGPDARDYGINVRVRYESSFIYQNVILLLS